MENVVTMSHWNGTNNCAIHSRSLVANRIWLANDRHPLVLKMPVNLVQPQKQFVGDYLIFNGNGDELSAEEAAVVVKPPLPPWKHCIWKNEVTSKARYFCAIDLYIISYLQDLHYYIFITGRTDDVINVGTSIVTSRNGKVVKPIIRWLNVLLY
jgi:acyl-coenzyme A synthetase/AMP-(fatty) acid ligase